MAGLPHKRPGDVILHRYMPGASEDEREAARKNLYAFAAALLRISARMSEEKHKAAIREEEGSAVESKT